MSDEPFDSREAARSLGAGDDEPCAATSPGEEAERVQCPNCCRLARVTGRSMGLLFYRCDLCETVGAVPAPPGFG